MEYDVLERLVKLIFTLAHLIDSSTYALAHWKATTNITNGKRINVTTPTIGLIQAPLRG
jgi:hypothetical protein